MKLCRIATVPVHFAMLLRQQLKSIKEAGIDVTIVSTPGPLLDELSSSIGVRCFPIPIMRTPNPIQDLISLFKFIDFLKAEKFDIIHSSTPKAGLIGAIGGFLTQTPIRIHTYTGQPWVELSGAVRFAARESDRLIAILDTITYADSISQRNFLVNEGLVNPKKICVLGGGSISGVDLERFSLASKPCHRMNVRSELKISESAIVIVFVGRVTKDKGIIELIESMKVLLEKNNDLHLLLVGQFEPERDPLPSNILNEISINPNIHSMGFVNDPERYLSAADIFCLPSYREGFGSVVIEAGAMELPTVATRITGLIDAVVDGETGILVSPKNKTELEGALLTLIRSPELRKKMGEKAMIRSYAYFEASFVNNLVIEEYFRLTKSIKD